MLFNRLLWKCWLFFKVHYTNEFFSSLQTTPALETNAKWLSLTSALQEKVALLPVRLWAHTDTVGLEMAVANVWEKVVMIMVNYNHYAKAVWQIRKRSIFYEGLNGVTVNG